MNNIDLGLHRVLLGVCGSAAACHAPALAGSLAALCNLDIKVVFTRSASMFTTAKALALNTRNRAYGPDDDNDGVAHLELTRWAELVLVLPSTANILSVAACAAASDLLSTCLVAAACPIVFAPSMNEVMWRNPGVQRNVATLESDGRGIIPPGTGPAAVDGKMGTGSLRPMPETALWLKHWLHESQREESDGGACYAS